MLPLPVGGERLKVTLVSDNFNDVMAGALEGLQVRLSKKLHYQLFVAEQCSILIQVCLSSGIAVRRANYVMASALEGLQVRSAKADRL